MKKKIPSRKYFLPFALVPSILLLCAVTSCGTGKTSSNKKAFFTSGNQEADQRAEQKMAKAEQLAGSGEGAGEKSDTSGSSGKRESGEKKGDQSQAGGQTNQAVLAEGKLTLYDRLGGAPGISNIVADFIPRALHDPRVNWERNNASGGGLFHHTKSPVWTATPEHMALLQQHMCEFLALATGGPSQYSGKEMKATHANMHISDPEFDAAIGDLKASLDRLKIANREQKELLAIVESTRPQIVTQH